MRPLFFNVFLGLTWVSLTGEFSPANLFLGFLLGYLLLLVFRRTLIPDTTYFDKVRQVINFITYFIGQLVLANLRVAVEVVRPQPQMRPGIVAIPLDIPPGLQTTLLANLITLTPGTLSLDVSDDGRTLYVHSMYVDDVESFRASIKNGFEQRVKELFA